MIWGDGPVRPAHTSGGRVNEFRIIALFELSPENEMLSGPFHNVSELPEARSSVEIAICPAVPSVIRICFEEGIHRNQFGEEFRFGVRFFIAPPEALTVYMSPPVEPSS